MEHIGITEHTVQRLAASAGFWVKASIISIVVQVVGVIICAIYVGGVFLGAGMCLTANTMASYVINARCPNNTGTILGFVMASNGLGGAIAMQLVDLKTMHPVPHAAAFSAVCTGKRLTGAEYLPGSAVLYITLNESELYRFSLSNGAWLPIPVQEGESYTLVAHTGSMDVLAARAGSKTCVVEVEGEQIRRYAISAGLEALRESAVFSANSSYMAMAHNGSYFLYPLTHPGIRMAGSIPAGTAVHSAAGPDGRLIVQGAGERLLIWQGTELIGEHTLSGEICGVWAGEDRVLALSDREMLLYDANGGWTSPRSQGYDSDLTAAPFPVFYFLDTAIAP